MTKDVNPRIHIDSCSSTIKRQITLFLKDKLLHKRRSTHVKHAYDKVLSIISHQAEECKLQPQWASPTEMTKMKETDKNKCWKKWSNWKANGNTKWYHDFRKLSCFLAKHTKFHYSIRLFLYLEKKKYVSVASNSLVSSQLKQAFIQEWGIYQVI